MAAADDVINRHEAGAYSSYSAGTASGEQAAAAANVLQVWVRGRLQRGWYLALVEQVRTVFCSAGREKSVAGDVLHASSFARVGFCTVCVDLPIRKSLELDGRMLS